MNHHRSSRQALSQTPDNRDALRDFRAHHAPGLVVFKNGAA